MDWTLFTFATAIWVFWGALFLFKNRVTQMTAALGREPSAMIPAITIIGSLALLNFAVFFIAYGIKVSWLLALGVVFGGYAISLLYALVTRGGGVYDLLLNPTVLIGLVAIPALSAMIWFRAF